MEEGELNLSISEGVDSTFSPEQNRAKIRILLRYIGSLSKQSHNYVLIIQN